MPLSIHEFGGGSSTFLKSWPDSTLSPMNPTIVEYRGSLLFFVRLIDGGVDDNEHYTLYGSYESKIGMGMLNGYTLQPEPVTLRILDVTDFAVPDKVEDVRAFVRGDDLFLVGSYLSHGDDFSWFQNVMVELKVDYEAGTATFWRELPRRWEMSREKNWTVPVMPTDGFEYIVDPSRVARRVNGLTEVVLLNPDRDAETLHGGTQALPVTIDGKPHWWSILHVQHFLDTDDESWKFYALPNGREGSYYSLMYLNHVGIFDEEGRLVKVGRPFYFDAPTTEFACGMIERGNDAIISYGFRDRESRIAQVNKWRLMQFSFPRTGLAWSV